MYRLAVFEILSQKNVISEKFVNNIIGINTSKIITVSGKENAEIKLYTSPSHIGYITTKESRQVVLSQLGYQSYDKEVTFTKTNRQSITLNISDIYYVYPKNDRVIMTYYNGDGIDSVTLISTFEDFINEINEIDVEGLIEDHADDEDAHHIPYTDNDAIKAFGGYIWDHNVGESTIFNELDSLIPNNGDKIKITGGINYGGHGYIASHAERINSTKIYIYCVGDSSNCNEIYAQIDDGGIDSYDYVSIAW